MEEKKILIKNLEANYKIAGEGPAVLILHGWNGSSNSWVSVIRNISKNGFKAICPDLPGFGKSQAPNKAWSVSDYAQWLLELTRFFNLKDYFIIAHSFGGRITIKFSVENQNEIKGLVFCGAAGIKSDPSLFSKMLYFLVKIRNAIFAPKLLIRFKDATRNLSYLFLKKRDYFKAQGIMKETMQKVVSEDLLPYISQIKIKTLLIWGEKDKMVPLRFAKLFKDNIEGSRLEIMKNVGHSPNLEVPDEFSKILIDFFKSLI